MQDPFWLLREWVEFAQARLVNFRMLRLASLAMAGAYTLGLAAVCMSGSTPRAIDGVTAALFLVAGTLSQVGVSRGLK